MKWPRDYLWYMCNKRMTNSPRPLPPPSNGIHLTMLTGPQLYLGISINISSQHDGSARIKLSVNCWLCQHCRFLPGQTEYRKSTASRPADLSFSFTTVNRPLNEHRPFSRRSTVCGISFNTPLIMHMARAMGGFYGTFSWISPYARRHLCSLKKMRRFIFYCRLAEFTLNDRSVEPCCVPFQHQCIYVNSYSILQQLEFQCDVKMTLSLYRWPLWLFNVNYSWHTSTGIWWFS